MTREDLEAAGQRRLLAVILALVGSLMALLPAVQGLVGLSASWPNHATVLTVAGADAVTVFLLWRSRQAATSLAATVCGALLISLGQLVPGVLSLSGGMILFGALDAPVAPRPNAREQRKAADATPGRSPTEEDTKAPSITAPPKDRWEEAEAGQAPEQVENPAGQSDPGEPEAPDTEDDGDRWVSPAA